MATRVSDPSPQEKALRDRLHAEGLASPRVFRIDDSNRNWPSRFSAPKGEEPAVVPYFVVPYPEDGRWRWATFGTEQEALDYVTRQRTYWSA